MTQWQGLVNAAVAFPEINNASTLLSTALTYLDALLQSGVYPDGVETEQASGYDINTAGDFFGTLTTVAYAGANAPKPPPSFSERVEQMWNYGAYVSDPNQCLPRNGDADLCNSGYNPSATSYFDRSDWVYLHTNGAQGTLPPLAPTQGPSSIFPWAGQIVMRSGYDRNATWAWFDVGPYGSSGHAHRDKLSLMLHARGSMLLVDSGRFAYQGTDLSAILHREYAGNTSAHNTLCLSDPGSGWCDQLATPALASGPVANSSWHFSPSVDWAYGNMSLWNGLKGIATHTRGVYYQRSADSVDEQSGLFDASADSGDDGDFLVVADVVTSDQARHIQASWHTHPNSTVQLNAAGGWFTAQGVYYATGQPTSASVCVYPATAGSATPGWKAWSVVRGQTADPTKAVPWQGWYSQDYDDAWASSTVLYEADVGAASSTAFAWLIIPVSQGDPCVGASISVLSATSSAVTVSVTTATTQSKTISVPIGT